MNVRWVVAAVAALVGGALAVPIIVDGGNVGEVQEAQPAEGASGAGCEKKPVDLRHTLKDMNGAEVRLADYKGKVLLVNFWGTWCAPCRAEIPELIALVDAHKDRGFMVLGLAQDDTAEDLRAFAEKQKMNYPSLLSTPEVEEAFAPLAVVPTSFVLDRRGAICLKQIGPVTREQVEKTIRPLL